jgi:hypothetical protein
MHIMPFTRHVIAVAGLSLALGLTCEFVYADDWYREHGLASYYGKGFHGRKAADGDRFSQDGLNPTSALSGAISTTRPVWMKANNSFSFIFEHHSLMQRP